MDEITSDVKSLKINKLESTLLLSKLIQDMPGWILEPFKPVCLQETITPKELLRKLPLFLIILEVVKDIKWNLKGQVLVKTFPTMHAQLLVKLAL